MIILIKKYSKINIKKGIIKINIYIDCFIFKLLMFNFKILSNFNFFVQIFKMNFN